MADNDPRLTAPLAPYNWLDPCNLPGDPSKYFNGVGGWTAPPGSGGVITSARSVLTAAQVAALHASPFTLVPAPGAGNTLFILGMTFQYKFVTTAYNFGAGQILGLFGTSAITELFSVDVQGLFNSTNDTFCPSIPVSAGGSVANRNVFENEPWNLTVSDASVPSQGDGTLTVNTFYAVISLS